MQEVEGEGNDEADKEGKGDPLVPGSDGKHVFGETSPGDGLRVVLLNVLTRPYLYEESVIPWFSEAGDLQAIIKEPYICSFDGKKDIALVVDNGCHHDIVENGTDYGSHHLCGEGALRTELCILCQLQVYTSVN